MVSYFSQQINNIGDYVYNIVCSIYIGTKTHTLRIKRHIYVFVYVYNKTSMDMKKRDTLGMLYTIVKCVRRECDIN